jgi:hypothetical protein
MKGIAPLQGEIIGKDFVYLFIAARAIFQLSGGCHHYRWQGCKFRPMLGTQGLWAGRGLYHATLTAPQGLGLYGLPKDRHPCLTVGFEPPMQGSSDLCVQRSNHCATRTTLKIFFSRTSRPNSIKLGTNYPWMKGNQVCSNRSCSKGRWSQKCQNGVGSFKNLLFQNWCANFNQTWHKSSLGVGDSSLSKRKSKNTLNLFKNLLLQNQQTKFNQTWYKLSLDEGKSKSQILFKGEIMKTRGPRALTVTWVS